MHKYLIPPHIRKEVHDSYGRFFSELGNVSIDKITDDVLSFSKPHEQIKVIERYIQTPITGKKLLEIGSGFGALVTVANLDYQIDAYGIEPSSDGFAGSYEHSVEILKANGVSLERVISGEGEQLPFGDNSFDIVYSSNVLEHVNNPSKVFDEAIRVCKPGGLIQFVIPNYGSFYEGHYACWYLPYMPKFLFKIYVRFILGRDASFVDTLQTQLNYFSIMKILRPYQENKSIQILGTGEDIFLERITSSLWTPYAGLQRVQSVITILNKLKLVKLVAHLLLTLKAHSPLIITLKKLG